MALNFHRMSELAPAGGLIFPRYTPPPQGGITEIALGVLWLRLALPFALDHVNIYLISDGAGWAVLDTGVADTRTRAAWERVLADELGGRPVTRLIVTHNHPDHVGLAGWFHERYCTELYMSQVEYLFAQNLIHNPDAVASPEHAEFYRRHGLNEAAIDAAMSRGRSYVKLTSGLPGSYHRLEAGDRIGVGGRELEVLTGGGHSQEQLMLLDREAGVFFAADQVLARISPNIGVWPWEPLADPLGDYLKSLSKLRAVPDDVLVLPAHNLPFYGLHQRLADLERHHEARCAEIAGACGGYPRTIAEILPVLFPRALDPHQTGFAFGEVLAHVNHMVRRGELAIEEDAKGMHRVRRLQTPRRSAGRG